MRSRSSSPPARLDLYDRLHMRHRLFRYRYRSERPSICFLRQCDLEGKTLVDVGANYGIYSYYMSRKAGPSGAVFAFEPQPELLDHLQRLKQAFRLDNLTVVNKGLSSATTTLKMTRPSPGSGEAGVNLPEAMFSDALEIEVTTLDEYLDGSPHRPVSFLKADIQGHEYDAFKGALGILTEDQPLLLFEHFDYEAEAGKIFSLFTDLGYDGWFYYVRPADHASFLRSGRGKYVNFTEYDQYEYVRPSVNFRNYIFAQKDSREARALTNASGKWSASAAVDYFT